MRYLTFFSAIMIPLLAFVIVGYGLLEKKKIYDCFIKGAKEGMKTVVQIAPTLIGLMLAVGVLSSSGFLVWFGELIGGVTEWIHFPSELVPLMFVKMFSSSAATGLVLDIFKRFGTDSFIGLTASIMMSCTETIFYTMSVYFIAAKVIKTRWTLAGALVSTLTGVVASVILAGMM